MKRIVGVLCAIIMGAVAGLCGCGGGTLPFLHAEGGALVDAGGNTVMLRGTNASNYMVTETWMGTVAYSSAGTNDHKNMTSTLVERFGAQKTVELWQAYRDSMWTDADFKNLVDMDFNVVRLPFTYMNIDTGFYNIADNGSRYNFEAIDAFIAGARKHGLYVILDLHGAYGSQNGQDHSGEILALEDVDFYSNEQKINDTAALWEAIAERYRDEPTVAAYDILNEPGERAGATGERHWKVLDRLYKAVRSKDERHAVIFEACWDGWNLPSPTDYDWTNCIYSFHNYAGSASKLDETIRSYYNKLQSVEELNYDVPMYMGEFNCYGDERSWEYALGLMEQHGWSWTNWAYKLNYTPEKPHPGWGIYYTAGEPVYVDTDSYDVIKSKIKSFATDSTGTYKYEFESGRTLFDVLRARGRK